MLFYWDLDVFAVKRKRLRLMDESSGPDVRHTRASRHIHLLRGGRGGGRTLASFLTSPSLSFICEMGINRSQRIQWGKTHTGPTQSGSGSFYLKGKVLLAGSDWAWGPWFVLLLGKASG